jgi:hypothetical protein
MERRLAHRAAASAADPNNGNSGGANTGANSNGGGSDSGANGDGNSGGSGAGGASSATGNSQSQGSTTSPSATTADSASTSTANSQPAQSTDNNATSQQQQQQQQSTSVSDAPAAASSSSSSSTAQTSSQNLISTSSSSTVLSTTSTASSTSTSASSSSTLLAPSTSTLLSTFVPTVAALQTSSFAAVSAVHSSSTASDAESTTSAKPSGAINTGAVVGGIAGGLAGLAFLGFLVAFILRRINKKRRVRKFEAAQFRRSAMTFNDEELAVPRPPEMVQNRANNYTDSVTSTTSPGIAGAGAFRFQPEHDPGDSYENEHEYYSDQSGQHYYDENPAVAAAPAVAMQRLQPRQQYTFGQSVAGAENVNSFVVDNYGDEAHAVGQSYEYTAYSPPQTQHLAGAHSLGAHPNSINESDAYGGI